MGIKALLGRKAAMRDSDAALLFQTQSIQHIGDRTRQEDAFYLSDETGGGKGLLALVADGIGGLSHGADASSLAARAFGEGFSREVAPSPGLLLMTLLMRANERVLAHMREPGHGQCGSTIVSALLKGHSLSFISAGDSRIYLWRGGGLLQLNREHTYASELDGRAIQGELSLAQAATDPQRVALTSYLGMPGNELLVDRNLRPIQLLRGDRVLLMTDGVFSTLTEEEIEAAMRPDLRGSAMRLENAVLDKVKASQDNFTAVMIDCI